MGYECFRPLLWRHPLSEMVLSFSHPFIIFFVRRIFYLAQGLHLRFLVI